MSGSDDANLRRVLGLGVTVAVLLGAAAAGGSILSRTTNDVTAADAMPYAVIGALAAIAVAVLLVVALRLARAGTLGLRPVEWLAVAVIVAAIGALLGTARTPPQPTPDDVSPLSDQALELRQAQLGALGDAAGAGPVDLDDDGIPDRDVSGDEVMALDGDGDGRLDGYLDPCPPGSPDIEPRAGQTAFDVECDGTVERWLPYDRNIFLEGDERYVAEPPTTIPPEQRAERATDEAAAQRTDLIGQIVLALLALAAAIAVVVVVVRLLGRRRRSDDDEEDDGPDADVDADASPLPLDLERQMLASLDVMLSGPDPRAAICAAYGRLLEGFADVGLARRPEEAPEEHVRRCLAGARVDPRPVQQLVSLFALARFSEHPVDETHRSAAVAAMQAALASVGDRRLVSVGGPRADPGRTS